MTGMMQIVYDLAMQGNMSAIIDRALYLEALDNEYQPFARTLQELAQAFEDEKIQSLIKEHME